mmetsp:Transcript_108730/g.249349  ORF Transcript_108730/g.249349 Transcript_108730/m.249349 type:complete len:348 (-) Transcript_108730:52-1095(-)
MVLLVVIFLVLGSNNFFLHARGHAVSGPVLQRTVVHRILHLIVDLRSTGILQQPKLIVMMVVRLLVVIIVLNVIVVVVVLAYFDLRRLTLQVHIHPLLGNGVIVRLQVIYHHVRRLSSPEISKVDTVNSAHVADLPGVQIQKICVVRKSVHGSLANLQVGIPFDLKPGLELGPRLIPRRLHNASPSKRLNKMRALTTLASASSKAIMHWHFGHLANQVEQHLSGGHHYEAQAQVLFHLKSEPHLSPRLHQKLALQIHIHHHRISNFLLVLEMVIVPPCCQPWVRVQGTYHHQEPSIEKLGLDWDGLHSVHSHLGRSAHRRQTPQRKSGQLHLGGLAPRHPYRLDCQQ